MKTYTDFINAELSTLVNFLMFSENESVTETTESSNTTFSFEGVKVAVVNENTGDAEFYHNTKKFNNLKEWEQQNQRRTFITVLRCAKNWEEHKKANKKRYSSGELLAALQAM